ncbi:hypothetical protein [Phenylobacterium sp.]|jgi:hypothetical protein|uniref:hypothetical protein n=1 Tax=Phenylobacterium sp. TaxID=1871053 RepID=UPI002E35D811|nr:hypothetical protein [Phenylobacterium sp.]HEX4711640.1 hypothetical protein [Phenylobacterium sp.]
MSEQPARKRRLPLRWLSLAEFVGIVAVAIAALGYWDSHRERTQTDRERAAAEQEKRAEARAGVLKLSFLMTGTPESGGGRLRLATVHPEQVIQTQALSFPSDVRGDAVQTTGNPRIEAGWFEGGLDKALHTHGSKARQGRLPVGIVTVFIEDGQTKTDRALYLVGYSLHPRVLRSDRVELEGLSLLRRGVGEDVQGAVDARWASQAPAPARP